MSEVKRELSFSKCNGCGMSGLDFYQPENLCVTCLLAAKDAEIERLKEIISYLPKVPTQTYEKEMAQEIVRLKAELPAKFYSETMEVLQKYARNTEINE